LWRSDGTPEGTVQVSGVTLPSFTKLMPAGNLVYYINGGLWRSDGSPDGTFQVNSIQPSEMADSNGALYAFVNGSQTWKSDGSIAGPVLVKDFGTPAQNSGSAMISLGDEVYFRANDGVHGTELWKSDGTADGTLMVKDVTDGTGGSQLSNFGGFAGKIYFLN